MQACPDTPNLTLKSEDSIHVQCSDAGQAMRTKPVSSDLSYRHQTLVGEVDEII